MDSKKDKMQEATFMERTQLYGYRDENIKHMVKLNWLPEGRMLILKKEERVIYLYR